MKAPKAAPTLAELHARWERGEPLKTLVPESGFKRSKLRRLLVAFAGGTATFKAKRARGAGGSVAARPTRINDDGVPTRKHCRASDGWTHRRVWHGVTVKTGEGQAPWRECAAFIFRSPKGNEYVQALDTEKADLIVKYKGYGVVRLRKYAESTTGRAVAHARTQVERGKVALERQAEARRARKAARTARRKTK